MQRWDRGQGRTYAIVGLPKSCSWVLHFSLSHAVREEGREADGSHTKHRFTTIPRRQ